MDDVKEGVVDGGLAGDSGGFGNPNAPVGTT